MYNNYFRNINLFFLDKEMNLQWSTEIEDRDMMKGMSIITFPNMMSNKLEDEQYLQPTITDKNITFIYTTTEPEDEIKKVRISLTDGRILEQFSLFENNGYASYYPGNQIDLGQNTYATILGLDDYYFVKYKLLK